MGHYMPHHLVKNIYFYYSDYSLGEKHKNTLVLEHNLDIISGRWGMHALLSATESIVTSLYIFRLLRFILETIVSPTLQGILLYYCALRLISLHLEVREKYFLFCP